MNGSSDKSGGVSLAEVHGSVGIPRRSGVVRRLFAFAGPAYLVSVGYMDPGNWATDLEGGARFGYRLIWVLLMSNLMAVLLQTLAARMGIVTGRDLAQACRQMYSRPVGRILWALCEVAIAACDLAEVLGTAIGLNLLLKVPLLYGVLITGLDTMLFLVIQNYGIRKMEAFILMLVATIGACFGIEVFLSRPAWGEVAGGVVPWLGGDSLYVAVAILGATVMPHNLYLHSALVQTRAVDQSEEGKREACRFNLIDTAIALNAAFLVNAAILIVSAAVFFRNGIVVTEIQQAHSLLTPLLGTALASTLFAVALISAGQSSTLTGTLAGQIVMEGFLRIKLTPVVRRLITRLVAIVPAVAVIAIRGDQSTYGLLLLSQVILSLQLPFAVIPLLKITGDRKMMGTFASKRWVGVLGWTAAGIIVVLNANLIVSTIAGWIHDAGPYAWVLWATVVPLVIGVAALLAYVSLPPSLFARKPAAPAAAPSLRLMPERYRRIGVAIDYGFMDAKVLSHARSLAAHEDAELFLFHVVEGVSGQVFGEEANDEEARGDREELDALAAQLRAEGSVVHTALGFGRVPVALVALAHKHRIDLLVMGGHGHRGLKDILFGTSVTEVRHQLAIPVLVVH